ncbi:MAG: hypothetical protein MR828_07830, partial [Clostridiales bacterium]|nr:hypothetical protein [Clostridiales bacterium]
VAARNVTKLSVPLNGIMSDIVRIRPTRFIFVDYTAREATSLPYTGWAVVVVWHAKTLPGTTQESRMTHMPVRIGMKRPALQIKIFMFQYERR